MSTLAEKLLRWVGFPQRWDIAWAAGVIAAAMVLVITFALSFLASNVVARALRRIAARTQTNVDDKLIEIAERPLRHIIDVAGAYIAISELPLPDRTRTFLTGVLLVIGVFVGVRLLGKVAAVLLLAYAQNVADDEGQVHFEKDYLPLLRKVIGVVLAVIGLIYVLHHFGQNVSSLVAALGIGGIAISFAAQQTLGNMFAGFAILVDRPFRPGDRIKLASGEIGDVIEVGTRSTRLKLIDHNMLIVPNSELMNTRVVNFNYPTHASTGTIELKVAADADVDRVKLLITEVLAAQPEIAQPPPSVTLLAFNGEALTLSASYVISEFADATKVQDRVRVLLVRRLRAAGVKIV